MIPFILHIIALNTWCSLKNLELQTLQKGFVFLRETFCPEQPLFAPWDHLGTFQSQNLQQFKTFLLLKGSVKLPAAFPVLAPTAVPHSALYVVQQVLAGCFLKIWSICIASGFCWEPALPLPGRSHSSVLGE